MAPAAAPRTKLVVATFVLLSVAGMVGASKPSWKVFAPAIVCEPAVNAPADVALAASMLTSGALYLNGGTKLGMKPGCVSTYSLVAGSVSLVGGAMGPTDTYLVLFGTTRSTAKMLSVVVCVFFASCVIIFYFILFITAVALVPLSRAYAELLAPMVLHC